MYCIFIFVLVRVGVDGRFELVEILRGWRMGLIEVLGRGCPGMGVFICLSGCKGPVICQMLRNHELKCTSTTLALLIIIFESLILFVSLQRARELGYFLLLIIYFPL